jgi:hypothetical protein
MIDLACPKCGRAGQIPREKINTRLVCKKCLVVFHVNTSGRTLLGEPHNVEGPKAETHQHDGPRLPSFEDFGSLKESMPVVSPKSLLIGLGALVVGGLLFLLMTREPESLGQTATATAERFAADDLAYLKQIATSDTIDDVVRWFDAVHPSLVKSREQWKTSGTKVQVMIVDEDRKQRRGEAHAYIYPAAASSHGTSITEAANAVTSTGAATTQPVDLKLLWILDGAGHWKLDGRQTFLSMNRPM